MIFSSCATLLNKKSKTFTIQLDKEATIVVNHTDTLAKAREFRYKTLRGRDTLKISVLDSNSKVYFNYDIYPEFSQTMGGNFFTSYGLFSLIDMRSDKAYSYPDYVFLKTKDTNYLKRKYSIIYTNNWFPTLEKVNQHYQTFQKTYKNDLFWKFGISTFSTFTSNDLLNQQDIYFSTLDLSAGLDYYYSDNRFLSVNLFQSNLLLTNKDNYTFSFPMTSSSFVKSIKPMIYSSQLAYSQATMFQLQHKHQIKKFSLGYGANFTYYQHYRAIEYLLYPLDLSKLGRNLYKDERISVGPIFSFNYLMSKHWNIGFVFSPTVLSLNSSISTKNENFLSLYFDYRFKMHPPKKYNSSTLKK